MDRIKSKRERERERERGRGHGEQAIAKYGQANSSFKFNKIQKLLPKLEMKDKKKVKITLWKLE